MMTAVIIISSRKMFFSLNGVHYPISGLELAKRKVELLMENSSSFGLILSLTLQVSQIIITVI